MAKFSPRARRLARELETAIAEGRCRDVVTLVDSYGLPRDQNLHVARELDRQTFEADAELVLRFDQWDRAAVRTVSDVWARQRIPA